MATAGTETTVHAPPGGGLLLAIASAASFGLSGPLARGLLDVGWSPGAVVLVRVAIAALVVAPLAARALRGRWRTLRANALLVLAYGAVAIAGAQFAYFSAVARMDVGPALLIEYTAPAAVVVWLWARHGERPRRMTLIGAAIAAAGLVLVLDLLSGGVGIELGGVLWALAAMLGAATYFVLSARTTSGLPPQALAGGGLVTGSALLGLLGAVGLLPLHAGTTSPAYAGTEVVWWLPLLGLGVVTAGVAYVTGIAASRLLGSRVASFVALLEVVAGVVFAWLLLDQLPRTVQLLGGALVLTGIAVVKLAERPPVGAAAPQA